MTITLTPDLEEALNREAQSQGRAPEELALQSIRRDYLPAATPENGESALDFLRDFVGILHSGEHVPGGARMSERTGEAFSELMLKKRAEGTL